MFQFFKVFKENEKLKTKIELLEIEVNSARRILVAEIDARARERSEFEKIIKDMSKDYVGLCIDYKELADKLRR